MVFVRECRGRQKEERSKGDGYVPGHGVDVREPKPNDEVSAVANERWRTRGRRRSLASFGIARPVSGRRASAGADNSSSRVTY